MGRRRTFDRRLTGATGILAGMHIAFLGFGLIAGSVARAVRATGRSMAGRWPAGRHRAIGPEQARADGILNVAATSPNTVILGADIVVLGAPATECLDADRPARRSVALGTAGRRGRDRRREHEGDDRRACGCGRPALRRRPSDGRTRHRGLRRFRRGPVRRASVGGRARGARAGRRTSSASRPSRTRAGPSPSGSTQPTTIVRSRASATCRSSSPRPSRRPSPARGPDWPTRPPLAAGGWRDTTRVARGDPAMGAAILATNAPAVAARLRDLRAVLDEWIAVLDRTSSRTARTAPTRSPCATVSRRHARCSARAT